MFAHFLKDKGTRDFPRGADVRGRHRTSGGGGTQWPPTKQHRDARPLFRRGRARSRFDAAAGAARRRRSTSYVSDPAHPVPYRQRPIQPTYFPGGSKWSTWLVEDQRFVDDRADVLSWETPPLEADVTIAGEVVAHLFASTTGSDADWIVKLIDVYPENYPENWDLAGYQLMVSNEVFRGRYRTSFEKPAADRAEQGARVHVEPAHAELHVPEGPPHHGAGAEHVVPDHRPQPADVRAEHLRGEGERLQGGDAPHLPQRRVPFAGGDSRCEVSCGFAGSRARALQVRRSAAAGSPPFGGAGSIREPH